MIAMRTMIGALGSMGAALGTAGTEVPSHDDDVSQKHYRTIFISDLHLGTPGCQALDRKSVV